MIKKLIKNLLYYNTKKKLDSISKSFCVAKWKQVTLYLQDGRNHSCHHPNTHLISINEIISNPSALHNTQFKKEQRKMMLEGVRPNECNYCWKAEDVGIKYSERIIKSNSNWGRNTFNEILSKKWNEDIDPSYLEVSFSSICNLKCSYCGPDQSSSWQKEILLNGGYPTSTNFNSSNWITLESLKNVDNQEDNEYQKIFWKWLPTIYDKLQNFRITGGEPLLSKHIFRFLDFVIDNPNPKLNLSINTNLCVPEKNLKMFIDKIKFIDKNNLVKTIQIHTSAEAYSNKAEYIRFGLNYNKWFENCKKILLLSNKIKLEIMISYNCLSVTSFSSFLLDINKLKKEYNTFFKERVRIGSNYIRNSHQSIFILDKKYAEYIKQSIQFMEKEKFSSREINEMKSILKIFENEVSDQKQNRLDFYNFIVEHDRRRKTNFKKTFPEMVEFFEQCKGTILIDN